MIIQNSLEEYLQDSLYIDWQESQVLRKAQELAVAGDEFETVRRIYYFVRDEISHSFDVADPRITLSASQALKQGVGICYAKSNLLAALLRANGIPAGLCYQRLTLGDTPATGFCIHALNAVYLSEYHKWLRIDARGNKAGVEAEIDPNGEKLAFQVRPEIGEIDYPAVYAEPLSVTMNVLAANTDALEMYRHGLPSEI